MSDFKALNDFINSLETMNIPGGSCAVTYKGKKVFCKCFGYADIDKKINFEEDTLFNLYSLTKVITCVMGMRLIEQKKLNLKTPLYEFIPEYSNMYVKNKLPNGDFFISPCKHNILVKDLFTMTSGISYNLDMSTIGECRKNGGLTTLDFVKAFAKEPLEFEPSTRWLYGLSHDVLGAVLEIVSGKPLDKLYDDEIFTPLNMSDTSFNICGEKIKRQAMQYSNRIIPNKSVGIGLNNRFKLAEKYFSGGAGLISSLGDYLTFATALANDGIYNDYLLLSQSGIDFMRLNQLNNEVLPTFNNKQCAGYGYGMGVRTFLDDKTTDGLSNKGEYGWDGAGGTYTLIDPMENLAIFYAQQVFEDNKSFIQKNIKNLTYKALNIR